MPQPLLASVSSSVQWAQCVLGQRRAVGTNEDGHGPYCPTASELPRGRGPAGAAQAGAREGFILYRHKACGSVRASHREGQRHCRPPAAGDPCFAWQAVHIHILFTGTLATLAKYMCGLCSECLSQHNTPNPDSRLESSHAALVDLTPSQSFRTHAFALKGLRLHPKKEELLSGHLEN